MDELFNNRRATDFATDPRSINEGGDFDAEHVRPTRLEVDLDDLEWNLRQIKNALEQQTIVCASMKANAYGHGSIQAARTALANGAGRLSVAFLDEAIELRDAGISAPILILGALETNRAGEVVSYNLTQTVSSYAEAKKLSDAAQRLGAQAAIHIKIDTGMGRLGFLCTVPSTYYEINAAATLPGIRAEGIYTHFATADEADASYTEWQLEKFNTVCIELEWLGLRIPIRHSSNSAAISGFPNAHMNMVRPGISLYGGAGRLPGEHHRDLNLRRVMSLRTKIALVKNIPAGSSIGYGRQYTANRDTRIATLPVGYGDGYSRGLSCGRGEILIGGLRAPIAGIICMDQCMVDITEIEGARVGDEAVLFGKQGGDEITLEEISKTLATIPYEIMCAISRRVPRVYIKGGKPVGYANYL